MYAFTQTVINALKLNSSIVCPVYPTHITGINNPVFPCISLGRKGGGTDVHHIGPDFRFQIDVWSKGNSGVPGYTEVNEIYLEIKKTLEMTTSIYPAYDYLFTAALAAGIIVAECIESNVDDELYEPSTRTYHLAAVYNVRTRTTI
ncbi:MAG: hypothetical protein WCO84_07260 [bacterium]